MTELELEILPWQRGLWTRLQQARQQGRMPHAMLFSGPAGVGKTHFARLFSRGLLCHSPNEQGEPCGQCRQCHLLRTGNHPDLQLLGPEEGSKSGEIKVDMIRSLTSGTALTAHSGGPKVVLIKPAERMNPAAANSLLKTLEEPTTNTILILLSDHPSRLLPTIRSRCQQFVFPHPKQAEALSWLEHRVTPGKAKTLLYLAGGAPLRALELASEEVLNWRTESFTAFIGLVQAGRDPVKLATEWSKQDYRQLMEWLMGWIIDMIRLRVSPNPPFLFNWDEKPTLQSVAEQLDSSVLQRFLVQVYESRNLVETNLNPQLLLEKLLIEWYSCTDQVT